jgi:hypothetical protein
MDCKVNKSIFYDYHIARQFERRAQHEAESFKKGGKEIHSEQSIRLTIA